MTALSGGPECQSCESPSRVTWVGADGRVVASFDSGFNFSAPPFVKGSRGQHTLRALTPGGVLGARLDQSAQNAIDALRISLGAPAQINVPAGGCGVDHESVWTSPATAEPLTLFQHNGRLVGYRYGAPVSEVGLAFGPGAVLQTQQGLGIGQTIGQARRIYPGRLSTSISHGGTWRAGTRNAAVAGSVLPIRYPLRVITAKNPIVNIGAGDTGCPSR